MRRERDISQVDRSWNTRMESVLRQFAKLVKERPVFIKDTAEPVIIVGLLQHTSTGEIQVTVAESQDVMRLDSVPLAQLTTSP